MIPSTATPAEQELVRSAQSGVLDAFTKLYETYFPMVFNRVRYSVPQEDVEDVTQEVFIAVMRSLKNFRGDARFSTWLRTLTNRQIAEYYRRRRNKYTALDERMHTPQDDARRENILLIQAAFRKIPEKYREILLLRFAEEVPFQEIARLQGRTLDAVKSLYRRALAALHQQVDVHE